VIVTKRHKQTTPKIERYEKPKMPTDEDDQDGHFVFNHPERGGYSAA